MKASTHHLISLLLQYTLYATKHKALCSSYISSKWHIQRCMHIERWHLPWSTYCFSLPRYLKIIVSQMRINIHWKFLSDENLLWQNHFLFDRWNYSTLKNLPKHVHRNGTNNSIRNRWASLLRNFLALMITLHHFRCDKWIDGDKKSMQLI